jgi:hypothetical protein
VPSLRNLTRFPVIIVIAVLLSHHAHAEDSRPSEAEIKQAIKALKQDPNLIDEQKVNTLHWVEDKDKQEQPDLKIPGWLRWIRSLFKWMAHTSRLLLWTVITVLVAFVAMFLLRVFRNYQSSQKLPDLELPKHVRDMDIRPESLPDDIGAAAWQLWQQNEHRAALALLYRGLLSRLVHVHAVPIKDSSTEAQCLELARAKLQSLQSEYVARALKVWQYAVYGARLPEAEEVQALCDQFDSVLDKGTASTLSGGA